MQTEKHVWGATAPRRAGRKPMEIYLWVTMVVSAITGIVLVLSGINTVSRVWGIFNLAFTVWAILLLIGGI